MSRKPIPAGYAETTNEAARIDAHNAALAPTNQASGVAEPVSLELAKGVIQSGYDAAINALKSGVNDPEAAPKAVRDFLNAALAAKPAAPAEVEKALADIGREMVNITTTVWHQDEWPAIPGLWLKCMEERDELRAKLAALRTPAQAPSPGAVTSLNAERYEWLVANYDVRSLVQVGDLESLGSFIDRKRDDNDRLDIRADAVRGCADSDHVALTAPPVVQPASPAVEVAELLSQFEVASVRCAQLHREYIGKAMSDQTYDTFATLRDDTIPALRKRLLAMLTPPAPAAVTEVASLTDEQISAAAPEFGHGQAAFIRGANFAKRHYEATPHPAVAVPGSLTELREAFRPVDPHAWPWTKEQSRNYPQKAADIINAARRLLATTSTAAQPRLKVVLTKFPESNGNTSWTALLMREEPWDGLIGNCNGITIDRGECWNRVAYEAERAKYLLGLRNTEPYILDYGDDIKTPDEWKGETAAQPESGVKP